MVELAATALVGGFDVALGVIAFALADESLAHRFGTEVAQIGGAIAFGVGFVFIVVGRSELFTENFLVPIAGLHGQERRAWLQLGELWGIALLLNLLGGTLLAVIATSHDVLRRGAAHPLVHLAEHLADLRPTAAFLSAVIAGALMTLMTWFVEGAAESSGVRIVMAWIVGALIVLGTFNHAVVSTIEIVFGMRYGADVSVSQLLANLGLSIAGNLAGGLGLVTFARFTQAVVGRPSD